MKTVLTALKWTAGILAILIAATLLYIFANASRTYDAPFPDIVASQDSSVIARGEHLVHGPAHCSGCHASKEKHEEIQRGIQVALVGGGSFDIPPGTLNAPNLTPDKETGIGRRSDGELARTLRYGIRHDGMPVLDLMPFYDISDSDLTAIISYLRSMEPVDNMVPDNDWRFLGKALIAFGVIKPMGDADFPEAPMIDSTAAYGEYIARSVANCVGCHTDRDLMTGAFVSPDFSGQFGMDVVGENGETEYFISPNLTPDPNTGRMTSWTQDDFVSRFQEGPVYTNSPMPWGSFGRMSNLELVALYKFLSSLDPVEATKEIPVGPVSAIPSTD